MRVQKETSQRESLHAFGQQRLEKKERRRRTERFKISVATELGRDFRT